MKFMQIWILLFAVSFVSACTPASKKALEETRKDLSELAKAHQKLAESHNVLTKTVTTYVEMPEKVKEEISKDADNRVDESTKLEKKIEENSRKNVGIFSKQSFIYTAIHLWGVAQPVLEKTIKVVGEVASSQGGVIGAVATAIMAAYGIYTKVSASRAIAKTIEEKEIEIEVVANQNPEERRNYKEIKSKAVEKIKAKKIKI